MAELPNPHTIAIGALIALYADRNSPLFDTSSLLRKFAAPAKGNKNNYQLTTTEKHYGLLYLELSRLIQQLVMREEEDGLFALLDTTNDSSETAGPVDDNNADDPIDVIEFDMYNTTHHNHDEKLTDDFLNDLLLGTPLSLSSQEENARLGLPPQKETTQPTDDTLHNNGGVVRKQPSSSSSSQAFRLHTLTSVLDSIDNAWNLVRAKASKDNSYLMQLRRKNKRSPPSKALLGKLQIASASIDDLMNLLDEWHALLDGTHKAYWNAAKNSEVPGTAGGATVSIDGESTFGVHLRKLCLSMEELPFEAVSRLWMALRSELDMLSHTEDEQEEEEEEEINHSGDINNSSSRGNQIMSNTPEWLPSTPQIERLLRRTCLHPNLESGYLLPLQNHHHHHNTSSSTTTTAKGEDKTIIISSIIQELQQTHPECPSISFFQFLSCLANGERSLALENLHRYFDYAMIHERKERAERAVMLQLGSGGGGVGGNSSGGAGGTMRTTTSGMGGITTMTSGMGGITGGMTGGVMHGRITAGGAGAGGPGNNNSSSATDAKIYKESNVMEYAAVLLAQMHYRFGFSRLALQATEEAVRVAQQSGDDECVSFANGWLAVASSSMGVGRGGVRNNSTYATVGGLPPPPPPLHDVRDVQSRGYRPLVSEGGNNCVGGRSTLEEEAMLQHCQTRAIQRGLGALSVGTSLELTRRTLYRRDAGLDELEGLNPSSSLAWDGIQRSGTGSSPSFIDNRPNARQQRSDRSATLSQIQSNIGFTTSSEAIGILGQQALAESGLWDSTGHSSLASLSSCRALYGFHSNEALRRVLSSIPQGPSSSGERGLYPAILDQFASMSDNASVPAPESMLSASAFLHEWKARSYDISMARNLQCLIASHAALSSNSLAPVETSLMLLTKATHLFLQQEDYERAKVSARQACWFASRHALFFHQGWHLLQLAIIDLEASTSASSNNIESSLGPILECLHLSERYVMDPLRAAAQMTLGRVFLYMGRICKARALLNAAIPLLMQHGHVWFQAEAYLSLAKCYLAEVSSDENKLRLRQNAVVQLEKAASLFEKIEDIHRLRQVYYLQARTHQFLPTDPKKRDEAAKKFIMFNKMKQHKLSGRKQWDTIHGVLINSDVNDIKSR